ncbi:MAG: DNA mismatch repair endonuclease MutL, partial [Clostridia bacterium]|nr:DNA mismatch repair endonuclease MutL [Clostridia bacterium]
MSFRHIEVLDSKTIDKIAAGEVVERPSSVVKELLENAIDAGATAITVEIKGGGAAFIRVTDNGEGIDKSQVRTAFFRHATSKIKSVEDLFTIQSLGFRGEALSSIAAVSQVELITKTKEALTGIRYVIEGAKEKVLEDIGAPDGTTFIVRNLFYNTPARQKFLKTPTTEASYITELMEHISMSHPDIAFKYLNQGQLKLQTSGNHKIQDIIYQIYGREISGKLLMIEDEFDGISIKGEIGKPEIARSNRKFEHFFVNGRYIKSSLIMNALEEAYKAYLMLHKYPFAVLYISIDPQQIDVNVHPNKMELRFLEEQKLYQNILKCISRALAGKDLIPVDPSATVQTIPHLAVKEAQAPEPFEKKRIEHSYQEIIQQDLTKEPVSQLNQINQINMLNEDQSYGKIVLPSVNEPQPQSTNIIKADQ